MSVSSERRTTALPQFRRAWQLGSCRISTNVDGYAAMRWLFRKMDSLLGAAMATLGAICIAQAPVFTQQYLQRLGGHVDEARFNLARIATEDAFKELEAGVRLAVEVSARDRLLLLGGQQRQILDAESMLRPVALVRHLDVDIAASTLDRFVPALPFDPAGLVYGGFGLVLGWTLFELIKALLGVARFLVSRTGRKDDAPARL